MCQVWIVRTKLNNVARSLWLLQLSFLFLAHILNVKVTRFMQSMSIPSIAPSFVKYFIHICTLQMRFAARIHTMYLYLDICTLKTHTRTNRTVIIRQNKLRHERKHVVCKNVQNFFFFFHILSLQWSWLCSCSFIFIYYILLLCFSAFLCKLCFFHSLIFLMVFIALFFIRKRHSKTK